MKTIKTNMPGFEKDVTTGVIINTNKQSHDMFRLQREERKKNKELESQINLLYRELEEIKQMLSKR